MNEIIQELIKLPALINETTFVRSKLTSYLAGEDLSVHVC